MRFEERSAPSVSLSRPLLCLVHLSNSVAAELSMKPVISVLAAAPQAVPNFTQAPLIDAPMASTGEDVQGRKCHLLSQLIIDLRVTF